MSVDAPIDQIDQQEPRNDVSRPSRRRTTVSYVVIVVVPAVIAVAILLRQHSGTVHPAAVATHTAAAVPVYLALLGIALIMVVAHALGTLAAKLRQPRVIGEIAAGLVLGPSVLGALAPGFAHLLWTPDMIALLGLLAQLGVVFFMFLVGRELPFTLLRGNGARAVVCGHASIALPLLGGVAIAVTVLAGYRHTTVPTLAFVLFCGTALSITAFPVLARVLVDVRLHGTKLGALGLATAAITDVTGWCVLTIVVAVVHGGSSIATLRTIGLTLVFAAVMWWLVRPALAALSRRAERGQNSRWLMLTMMLVLLCSAAITQAIGIQAIFGAFLAGLVAPRTRPVRDFTYRIEGPTGWFLMPLFFALTGIQVSLAALGTGANWLTIAVLILVAMAAKVIGGWVSARSTGVDRRSSMGLGVLMSCRGMTELIVLQLGLQLGILSNDLYVMFLVMAMVTTALTGPLLRALGLARTPVDRPVAGV
jgi:Kef-type K+ transport system membrane component KefB